jgi:hypothetical protein
MLAGAAAAALGLAPGTKSPEKFAEQLSERPTWIREKIR